MPKDYESRLKIYNKSIEDFKKTLKKIKPKTLTEKAIKDSMISECEDTILVNEDEVQCYKDDCEITLPDYSPDLINRKQFISNFISNVKDEFNYFEFKVLQLEEFMKKYKIKK